MYIEKFDNELLSNMISSYEMIDGEVKSLGESEVREHAPELLRRRDAVRGYIVNYSQLFIKGLANADNMDVDDILLYVKETSPKHNI